MLAGPSKDSGIVRSFVVLCELELIEEAVLRIEAPCVWVVAPVIDIDIIWGLDETCTLVESAKEFGVVWPFVAPCELEATIEAVL